MAKKKTPFHGMAYVWKSDEIRSVSLRASKAGCFRAARSGRLVRRGARPVRVPSAPQAAGGSATVALGFTAADRGRHLQRRGLGDSGVPADRGTASAAVAALPDDEQVGLGGRDRRRPGAAPPEQVSVEVFAERAADQVQGDRVDARVDERQAEPDDAEHVPERVVLVRGLGIVVEPQHEHVVGQEANGERQHEREHGLGHLFAGLHLPYLPLKTKKPHKHSETR